MAGFPTEAEVQTQWKNAVAILEAARQFGDTIGSWSTDKGASVTAGYIENLTASLEGEFTSNDLPGIVAGFRASAASLCSNSRATEFLAPIVREYARHIGFGSAYTDLDQIARAIYEHFADNSITVKSRDFTFDLTATLGASNVGNGSVARLVVDENGENIESAHPETKIFRCRSDANSGTKEDAEVFECVGEDPPPDSLLAQYFGSGVQATIRALHAGSGSGGSRLTNSSFDTYDSSLTSGSEFAGWTATAGAAGISQDTTNTYRSAPGASTDGALKLSAGSGTITIKQLLSDMRTPRLEPDVPYFLRIMVNKTVGSAVGGDIYIRLGSEASTVDVATMGSNWVELTIGSSSSWYRTFNEDPMDIEIEWNTPTSGFLLVDDVIFHPYTQIDGTWWAIRGAASSHTPWLVDDTIKYTDTAANGPADAMLQWWWWRAGFGYLPSTLEAPTIADPIVT